MDEYVIFSDIHGNLAALMDFLHVEKPGENRTFIFLGDVAGYYYDTAACVSLLKRIPGLIAVRGNHDQMYLDAYSDRKRTEELSKKYSTAYYDKTEDVQIFLEHLPVSMKLGCCGTEILIQHGIPEDPLEGRIYPDTALPVPGDGIRRVILTGHTHYRMKRSTGNTLWLNPGSLGQPRDGKGFSYCILRLTEEDWKTKVSYRTVKPDLRNLEQQIRERDPDHPYLWEVLHRGAV